MELSTPVIPGLSIRTLLDSGSSHCFVDRQFALRHGLVRAPIPPVTLRLFDGTSNSMITESVNLDLHFASGHATPLTLLVTPLDSACSVVLGLNWLTLHNPLVDWASRHLEFRTSPDIGPASPSVTSVPLDPPVDLPSVAEPTPEGRPDISIIGAAAFAHACRVPGALSFRLTLSDQVRAHASKVPEDAPDLSSIPEAYHDFADVFSAGSAETLAPHRPYDLKIDLEEGKEPPLGPIYSLSQIELQALREFVEENLNTGFIRPSKSAHGAPVLFVKKKNGSLRLCVDYRGLNRISKKDRYPLPLISDLLDAPRKARIYTKIDLKHAYHLVRIAEGDEWKTAFRTRYGSFEWLVMPFGLSNAPAAFQRFMNDIFADMLDVNVVVYLDDILIYSDTPAQHRKHVREVLRRLRQHGLYAGADKCTFDADTVEYLGYILSPDGLRMDSEKVRTIQDWPEPRKIKDIQSFLGFANFYRRFIWNYSDIVVPLTRLTRKDTPWNFSAECRTAFETLKKAFTTAPILTHWIPDTQIVIETDASDYALGAILSVICSDGEIRPVAFHSRTFSAPELNYDTHDKELLAIFEAFRIWRHYLEGSGTPIDVVTDHKNLEYFATTKLLTRRQARWSEFLSQFNLVIRFRPGKLGEKPDALTRRWDVYPKEGDSGYAHVNPHNFRPVFTQEQLVHSLRASSLYAPVLRAVQLMDVKALHEDIRKAQAEDPIASGHLLSPPSSRWTILEGLLHLDGRIWVPDANDLRLRILRDKHDHPLAGHFGQNRTLSLIRREYVWPRLRQFVVNYCQSCTACRRGKTPRHKPYGLLRQLPIPERPWDSISMDFIEQLPPSLGFTAILVIVDRLTKQVIFIPTTDTITSAGLAELFIIHVFSKHGVPGHITSDRGSEFVSHFMRSLAAALDMKLHFTSGYHPEGDGQTERANQTLEQYLRMYCNYQQDNWSPLLPLAEFAYNNAPSATTGISPFFANKGYHPNITVHPERDMSSYKARQFAVDLDELHQELKAQIAESQQRYQVPADKRREPAPEFPLHSQAFVRAKYIRSTRPAKKLSEKYLGPFEVIGRPGPASYTLRLPDTLRGVHPVFHVSMLEKAVPNTIPNRVQPPPPPVIVDGELEQEIGEILDSKIDRRRRCKLLYYVRWLGFEGTDEEYEWLPATELDNAQEFVADYHRSYPNKPGPHNI
jgi:transposase InsO family protein